MDDITYHLEFQWNLYNSLEPPGGYLISNSKLSQLTP